MSSTLLEAISTRKNKISLTDYNYQKDIQNRLLMADFTQLDLEVLEEILYSSLQIPLTRLAKDLDIDLKTLDPILKKLSSTGLFSYQEQSIVVDKETRKYFELQIQKFEEDFLPGMDFLQGLLKKVPIHVLPIWYAIPRTSNNIFDSLVEKNLLTPQIFLRYVADLNFGEPILKNIIEDVYSADDFEVSAASLIKKYKLTKELFEEYMLHLEFNFVCCLGYKKNGDAWEEKITPFHEWREYLRFAKSSEVTSIPNTENIQTKRPNDFSFAEDLSLLLEESIRETIDIETTSEGFILPINAAMQNLLHKMPSLSKDPAIYKPYIHNLIAKLSLVRLIDTSQNTIRVLNTATDWLEMKLDSKSLYFYRHPLNRILNKNVPQELCTEKAMREAEKSIIRALGKEWVFFDDFFRGIIVPLNEDHEITLKRSGKSWKYTIPEYSQNEANLLRSIILEWLFEAGLTQPGLVNGRDCFRITSLGQTLFAR